MKEKDLFRQVSDIQMPDLEKIRENIISGAAEEKKPKIVALKPSRLIAVAAIVAFALVGTIAAVASAGGGFPFFFNPQPATIAATSDEAAPKKIIAPKQTKPKKTKSKTEKSVPKTKEEVKDNLRENGYDLSWVEPLGKVGDYTLAYGGTDLTESCECDYVIDNYTFSCTKQYKGYGLGLYLAGKGKSYYLTEARFYNIIPDIDEVIKLLDKNADKVSYHFTYTINEEFADWLRNRLNRSVATYTKVGECEGFDVYYNLKSSAKGKTAEDTIAGVKITTNQPKRDYKLGLYVSDGQRNATLKEAFDNGWLTDIEKIEELIKANPKSGAHFSFEKEESEEFEEETESETEPETESETETEAIIEAEDETEPTTTEE
ncbi:MAG: hypothetical protein IIU14_08165 [Ruminococcus sp.]|nr:hypothetical protein [Ruminococcus sp.]